jgi:hypothetical protein
MADRRKNLVAAWSRDDDDALASAFEHYARRGNETMEEGLQLVANILAGLQQALRVGDRALLDKVANTLDRRLQPNYFLPYAVHSAARLRAMRGLLDATRRAIDLCPPTPARSTENAGHGEPTEAQSFSDDPHPDPRHPNADLQVPTLVPAHQPQVDRTPASTGASTAKQIALAVKTFVLEGGGLRGLISEQAPTVGDRLEAMVKSMLMAGQITGPDDAEKLANGILQVLGLKKDRRRDLLSFARMKRLRVLRRQMEPPRGR